MAVHEARAGRMAEREADSDPARRRPTPAGRNHDAAEQRSERVAHVEGRVVQRRRHRLCLARNVHQPCLRGRGERGRATDKEERHERDVAVLDGDRECSEEYAHQQ